MSQNQMKPPAPGGSGDSARKVVGGGAARGRGLMRWLDENILELGREMRFSYLPPLMVYMAAGISGLTSIVGTFFVKDYLGLSAAFLAALGFWAMIPWALKMPIGHLVDLMWRWKSALVFLGAGLIALSCVIMVLLIGDREALTAFMTPEAWYVLAVLLAPIGYVVQDTVADAMTVEAVPRVDEEGRPVPAEQQKLMHTTMQTLGRVAIIGGTVFVAVINIFMFSGVQDMPEAEKVRIYQLVYLMALSIPVISVLGVVIAEFLKVRNRKQLIARGIAPEEARRLLDVQDDPPQPNWWVLGGSLAFAIFTVTMGLGQFKYGQEIIFAGSFAIVSFLVAKLTRELDPVARETLIGTAIVIFVFRAVPLAGPSAGWWAIDVLAFDQQFFSVLDLTASTLTLAGMFVFRRFMAEHSITYIVGALTLAGAVLAMPYVGMYYGLHEWTARMSGGVVDARFIALVNTALESPLGQIAMIPMLAWIARSAPNNLKATFFAVMASFTNLALSASQLGTKYLNEIFVVTREVKDPLTGVVKMAADYSQLGELLIVQTALLLILPFTAIAIVRMTRLRTV